MHLATALAALAIALMLPGCLQGGTAPTSEAPGAPGTTTGGPLPPLVTVPSVPPAPPVPEAADSLEWEGVVELDRSTYVLPWQTLHIAPGTVVRFAKGTDIPGTPWSPNADSYIKDHDDPTGRVGYGLGHHELYGKIVALGTREQPIVFTSAASEPGYADWSQIILATGSRMENVTVEYAHNGINVKGDDVVLRNIVVRDSLWSCIDVFGARAQLRGIEASHCWHQAVGFKADNGGSLEDAYLHDSNLAVNCEGGAQPVLRDLTVKAAPIAPSCPAATGTVQLPGSSDTPGGTYGGRLIYPAQP